MDNKTNDKLFIKVKDLIQEIDRNILADDVFHIEFGDSYKLEITNENGLFMVTNAVKYINGYGVNCRKEFIGEKVSLLEHFDYAAHANKNQDSLWEEVLNMINTTEVNHGFDKYYFADMMKKLKSRYTISIKNSKP